MCLIVHTKDKLNVTKDFFLDVWNTNNDGWGMLWHNNVGQLRVKRGMDFKPFWAVFSTLQSNGVKDKLVHFRMATQGDVSLDMTHPFLCHKSGIWMLHNGIINYPGQGVPNMSDTALFVSRFLTPLLDSVKNPKEFIRTKEFEYMLVSMVGVGNRLTFSDNMGHVVISEPSWQETTTGLLVSNSYAFTKDKMGYDSFYGGECVMY
jgi:predicted glutamine amidotransferase